MQSRRTSVKDAKKFGDRVDAAVFTALTKNKIPPPYAHQKASLKFQSTRTSILDTSDPGTGKTRTQIDSFVARRKAGGKKLLVIAPKSLLRTAWQDDFAKFAPTVTTVVCTAEKRSELFKQEADVYITNTDAAVWLAKQPPKFFKQFDTFVIDEISSFKHHTSQRSKAMKKIAKYFPNRIGLTGTPTANSITEIWHQVFLLDDGKRLGKSFFQFRNAVCEPKQNGPQPNMVVWNDKPGAELSVGHLIADMVIRHKFEDCLSIPANHTYSVPYHMSKKQTKAYEDMSKNAIAQLESGRLVSAVNAASVMTKLLQIACICYDTPVLTDRGWIAIQNVQITDKVWDGEEWVAHSGSVLKGTTKVIKCHGVWMTPEHHVLTKKGWLYGKSSEKFDRADVRLPDSYPTSRDNKRHINAVRDMEMSMQMWKHCSTQKPVSTRSTSNASPQLWMPTWEQNSWNVKHAPILQMGGYVRSLLQSFLQRFQKLGCSWHNSLRALARSIQEFLYGYVSIVQTGTITWKDQQQCRIQPPKLSLGNYKRTSKQYSQKHIHNYTQRHINYQTSSRSVLYSSNNTLRSATSLQLDNTSRVEPVYDLINCGPQTRFVVMDEHGYPLIVHNSGAVYSDAGTGNTKLQVIASDALGYTPVDNGRYELVADLIEARAHCIVFFNWKHQKEMLVKEFKARGITYVVIDGTTPDKDRKEAVDHFQAGFYKVLLAHPQSAAHGLTLTKGTSTIWASPTYNLEHFLQGNRRIYRAGQTQKTETVVIISPGTIEEKVYARLQEKDAQQGKVLDLLKELFNE